MTRHNHFSLLALTCLIVGFSPLITRADVFTNVPEANAESYQLIYQLAIPNVGNFRDANAVPYSVNNSGGTIFYDRVGYYLELDTGSGLQYGYASMDSFNGNNLTQLGLPHNVNNPVKFQQVVNNLNVVSNKAGVMNVSNSATGNIEFWSTNYNQSNAAGIPGADAGSFDFGDGGSGIGTGYGSFQVHNHGAAQTVLSYSRWGTTGNSDLGIGNQGSGNPDWTFAQNANTYSTKNLQILVRPKQLDIAPANVIANAPEAATYSVVYQLPVQSAAFNANQYTIDNSSYFPNGSFDRVAYYLELDNGSGLQYAFVSMDPFTNEASKTGVPKTDVFEQIVNNLNVDSNVAGVDTGSFANGNIEFWGTNYGGNADSGLGGANSFDFDDTRSGGGTYGSLQVHNFGAGETILAYNRWGSGTGELGIGNQGSGNPDWTFSDNSGSYTVKNLWVLADVAGANLNASSLSGPLIDFGEVDANTAATLMNEVTLQNDGVMNSIINVSGFTLAGADPASFDVGNFSPTLLQGFFDDMVSFDVDFLGGAPGDYSAVLIFNTSEGDFTFNLAATAAAVPEPASIAIWSLIGLGLAGFGYYRVRRKK